ncbi:MAG: HDIG domain-containing metalloprotein [Nitrososphaerales archaeon]
MMGEQEAIDMLKRERSPEALIKHSMAVSEVSIILALALRGRGYDIDPELVKIGGLLHDIGRAKTHSVRHGYLGGRLLRRMGVDGRIARIAERHVGGGISKREAERLKLPQREYVPETLEEKVVCFADKIVEMDCVIPLEKTLEKFREELGNDSGSVKGLIELRDELTRLLDRDPEDIVRKRFSKEPR